MEHHFNVPIASQYGLEASILINHFQFWISKNKAAKRNEHDGNVWTYMSISGFRELFPYMKERTIRRVISDLLSKNVIISGNHNENQYDRTLWYAFDKRSIFFSEIFHLPKSTNGSDEKSKSNVSKEQISTFNVPNNNHIKKQMEEIIFPFISESFIFAWNKWKTYKKQEHKFTYKAVVTEQAALKKLEKISGKAESVAIEIIEESIANGYKGLFELKKKGFGSFNQPPTGKYNMQLEEQRRNYKPLEQ